ncbi:MAG: phosphate/phosphite/phosphonate ABC transporter substrate-binding protein [Deltaproteobacteria bacterium]|nr:phosphate/phosphite/phosphonate ABC transporter substrate-binding protein [Deltaproteobacteria bacterium]
METGRQLGRYQLLRLLGFGGMGEVYLASSKGAAGFEKLVTVKILRKQISHNTERVSDLMREAFIGVRLDHENIVQVFDLGEHEGTYFLVMEYMRGFSLREVISFTAEHREPLGFRPIAHAIRCMADALDYLHRVRGPHRKPLGLIHRDVSPSNILLGAEGRIKLSDFGVAGMAQDATRAGTVIGKPRYLPPEARHGEPATQTWDLYALGVVLHSALSGDADVEQSGNAGVSMIGARLKPLAETRPECPRLLVELVERATARDPAARLTDAATFRQLLDAAVPRQADDADFWRSWLQELYTRDPFVTRFGVLPHVEDLVPGLEPQASSPSPVAYVETVVVDAVRPIRFGLSPALGVTAARAQSERVAAWLRKRVEREVRPVVFADYQSLVDAISEGEVDFAWMPPVSLVQAAERGVGLVAIAQRFGRPTYESVIVVKQDSPLQSIEDLRGTSIAFVDRDSASGYLFVADLVAREVGPPDEVFREQHFQGSHKAVCDSVLRGWVDAGTTYVVHDTEGTIVHSGWIDLIERAGDLRALRVTDPIPCDALAHRPGLASGLVDRLAKTVADVDATDEEGRGVLAEVFHSSGMVRADMRIYDVVREAMHRMTKI